MSTNPKTQDSPELLANTEPFGVIASLGMSVPKKVITNEHFESYLDTSDEWIRERTGIEKRHWAEENESINDFILEAAKIALDNAGLKATDIDGIIVATATPENVFPSCACTLQANLGASKAFAYDLSAACSGFVYGLLCAQGHLKSGLATNVLVVGAEVFSRVIDKDDRSTCILFGDGAGAAVVSSDPKFQKPGRGIFAGAIRADGNLGKILSLKTRSADSYIKMEGREVFKSAVRSLADISKEVLDKAGVDKDELVWYISHQANSRILLSVADYIGLPREKVLINVSDYGNTSAASIPILLAETEKQGNLKEGDLIMISSYGGGATWGAMLVRW